MEPTRALVRLQRLTGARAGELVIMRGRNLDTSGKVWLYRPDTHKSAHCGFDRVIDIGPRGQAIIKPFLKPDVEAYLFEDPAVNEQRECAIDGGLADVPTAFPEKIEDLLRLKVCVQFENCIQDPLPGGGVLDPVAVKISTECFADFRRAV